MRYKFIVFSLLILLFLLIAGIALKSSQTGLLMSVYGWVKDLDTGKPIEGVEITFIGEERAYSAKSDRNGFYKVKYLEEGNYISISKKVIKESLL